MWREQIKSALTPGLFLIFTIYWPYCPFPQFGIDFTFFCFSNTVGKKVLMYQVLQYQKISNHVHCPKIIDCRTVCEKRFQRENELKAISFVTFNKMQLSSKNALSVILNLEIFFYVVSIIFQKKYQNTLHCKNFSYKKFGKMLENCSQKR